MNYKCGTCGATLVRLNDDCVICMRKEEENKKRIQEEYDSKNPKA